MYISYVHARETKKPSSHGVSHISCALIPVGCLFEINICAIATAVGRSEVVHGLQNLQSSQVLMKYNEIAKSWVRKLTQICRVNFGDIAHTLINIWGSNLAVCLVVVTLLCCFSAPVERLPGQSLGSQIINKFQLHETKCQWPRAILPMCIFLKLQGREPQEDKLLLLLPARCCSEPPLNPDKRR